MLWVTVTKLWTFSFFLQQPKELLAEGLVGLLLKGCPSSGSQCRQDGNSNRWNRWTEWVLPMALVCKALTVYKIKWACLKWLLKTSCCLLFSISGSKQHRSYQNNNQSITFASFENVLFPFKEEKIQINILSVMNIHYTHQLSNEKQGQLNTFTL